MRNRYRELKNRLCRKTKPLHCLASQMQLEHWRFMSPFRKWLKISCAGRSAFVECCSIAARVCSPGERRALSRFVAIRQKVLTRLSSIKIEPYMSTIITANDNIAPTTSRCSQDLHVVTCWAHYHRPLIGMHAHCPSIHSQTAFEHKKSSAVCRIYLGYST